MLQSSPKRYLFYFFIFVSLLCVTFYFFQNRFIAIESEYRVQKVNQKAAALITELKTKAKAIDTKSIHYQYLSNDLSKGVTWYIYQENKLIYWSSNDYILDNELLDEAFTIKRVNNSIGKYIAIKYKLDHTVAIALIFLERNYLIEGSNIKTFKNAYLIPTFKNHIIANDDNEDSNYNGLFGYQITFTDLKNESLVGIVFNGLIVTWLVLLTYFIFDYLYKYIGKINILWVIMILGGVRTIFYFVNNNLINNFDLFNSTYYASSLLSRSLADLIVNTIMLGFIFLLLLKIKTASLLYKFFLKITTPAYRALLVILLTGGVMLINYYFYGFISSLVTNSTINIDVNDLLNWHYAKMIIVCLIFVVGLVSFYAFHLLLSIQYKLYPRIRLLYVLLSVLFVLTYLVSKDMFYIIFFVGSLYAFIAIHFRLILLLRDMRYEAFLYLFLFAFLYSTIIGLTLYKHMDQKMIRSKNEYLENIINKRDLITEYLLNDASKKIKNDLFVVDKIISPFSASTQLRKLIAKKYLNDFYTGYEVQVDIYDANGFLLHKNIRKQKLNEYVKKMVFKSNYIKENDLYLIYDLLKSQRTYISMNTIESNGQVIGYVIIELMSKINQSVEPSLLYVPHFTNLSNDKVTYDYAVISGQQIEVSNGHFLYNTDFIKFFYKNKNLLENGFVFNGFHHVYQKTSNDRWVVVSTPYSVFDYLISNASFFFICSGIVLLVYIFLFLLIQRNSNKHLSFATRIQIYLNVGFFIPLFIASVVTLYLVDKNYQSILQEQYVHLSENLSDLLTNKTIQKNKLSMDQINELINASQDYTIQPIDFSIFSFNSNLIVSNNEEFYAKEIKSKKINYEALHAIKNGSQFLLLNESIADFNFYSIYRSIKSSETGKPIAILHVPFYASNKLLNEQVLIYVKMAMNLFVIGFLVLLIFGFFVAHQLTVPLRLITYGIRKTGLEDNERIEWNSDDELGRLVKEYNSMLLKIEESSINLSKAEKESAWREMARQVAHEIKNPLTPIKLKLQYLIYRIQQSDTFLTKEELKDAYNAMLLQIDTITEITNSFSAFNQLPQANPEIVMVNDFLEDVALVHQSDKVVISFDFCEMDIKVYADKKVLTGIFNNLLLNAQQSIPNNRSGVIFIKTEVNLNHVIIKIKDNGMGIPEDIQHKIFVPNFSTKYTGSGIGLALAKRLVEDMNGSISFESTYNVGTTFIIQLPLHTS